MAQQKPSYDASNIAEIVPNSRVSSRPTSSAQISFQVIFIGIANIDIVSKLAMQAIKQYQEYLSSSHFFENLDNCHSHCNH